MEKKTCRNCSTLILSETHNRNKGLCAPCFKHYVRIDRSFQSNKKEDFTSLWSCWSIYESTGKLI